MNPFNPIWIYFCHLADLLLQKSRVCTTPQLCFIKMTTFHKLVPFFYPLSFLFFPCSSLHASKFIIIWLIRKQHIAAENQNLCSLAPFWTKFDKFVPHLPNLKPSIIFVFMFACHCFKSAILCLRGSSFFSNYFPPLLLQNFDSDLFILETQPS